MNGYHPIIAYEGLTGDLIKAELRNGNGYTSNNVVSFVKPILKRYEKDFPNIKIYSRGDSGFADPKLYEKYEEMGTLYAIRLKANATLYKLSEELDSRLLSLCKDNMQDYKESKNGFYFNKMSSSTFEINENKLQIAMLAYNFNNWFRRLCFQGSAESFRIDTIRNKLIKAAAKVVRHAHKNL